MTTADVELGCAAVLFDLDGVLVDSGPTIERSWRRWATMRGIPEESVLAACHGRPSAETIAEFAAHLDAAAEASQLERQQALDTEGLSRCPGAARVITALPPGRWAVVTSGSRPLATARLRGVRLPVPEVMVTADDVSAGKPSPEGYLKAAERLGVPAEQCVVVEDARPGVLAARAAGCRVVGIAGDLLGPESEPDLVVSSLADLRVVSDGGDVTLHVRRAVHV